MSLHEKLAKIRDKMDFFQKTAKGVHSKYVPGAAILVKLRPLLKEHKVLLVPSITDRHFDGKNISMQMEMIWIDIESEDKLVVPWAAFGTANSGSDLAHAQGSALTYNERYFIMKFFQIPTDEDDADRFKEKHGPQIEFASTKQRKELMAVAEISKWPVGEVKEHLLNTYAVTSSSELTEAQVKNVTEHIERNPKGQQEATREPESTEEQDKPTHLTGKYPEEGMKEKDESFRKSFIRIRTADSMANFVHNPDNREGILYVKKNFSWTFEEMRSKFFKLCKDDGVKFPFDDQNF